MQLSLRTSDLSLCLFPSNNDLINPFPIKIAKIHSATQRLMDMIGRVGPIERAGAKLLGKVEI